MDEVVVKIENIEKQYRLGLVGTGTIAHDLKRWWYLLRGLDDPYSKLGETNRQQNTDSNYIWALKNINLEIKRGEVVGLIGRNGAGKSTLLKLLSQVTSPTNGSIKIKGRIASLLEVGTGFHPELTGKENIYLNGAILGMTKKEINLKFDEIVSFSGVGKYINTPVKRYSSGMMVRLGFSVAAHLEPEILVIDEVLAVGDADFQKKCIGKMKDVSKKGRTVIFVSHNMTSIRTLCDKGIVIESGEVKFQGSSKEAISHYLANKNKSNDKININIPKNSRFRTLDLARFNSVLIFANSSVSPTNTLNYQEKFKIISTLDVKNEIKNVSISIMILNEYGETITYAYSANNIDLIDFKIGIYQITFKIPINLMPGNYALGLSIYNYFTGSTIDYIDHFYPFKVLKETKSGNIEYPWATVHGYVEMSNDWLIEKNI